MHVLAVWRRHARHVVRTAWLNYNGTACGVGHRLRVALNYWILRVAHALRRRSFRALLCLRVLLRIRVALALGHWLQEASRRRELDELIDRFWPRFRRLRFEPAMPALRVAAAEGRIEQAAAFAISRSRALRFLRRWAALATELSSAATLLHLARAFSDRKRRVATIGTWQAYRMAAQWEASLMQVRWCSWSFWHRDVREVHTVPSRRAPR